MRIAITGATGFMGGALARSLAAKGHTIFSFGRRDAGAASPSLPNYCQWDLSDGHARLPTVDAVVHCAARVGDWGPDSGYMHVNVDGTRVVMDAFSYVNCFIHVSSASVYSSNQPGHQLSEDAPVGVQLFSAYARSKAAAEKVVLTSGRDAVILRPRAVYGPGDTTLLPRVLAARKFGRLAVPGNGRNKISVTHIANFIHAIDQVFESAVTNGVFNIADPEPLTVDELLKTLLRLHGAETQIIYVPRSIAQAAAVAGELAFRIAGKTHAPRLTRYLVAQIADELTLDLAQARNVLGYAPEHCFRDNSELRDVA